MLRIFSTRCPSKLGEIVLAATEAGLCGAWFAGQRHFPTQAGDWTPSSLPFSGALEWLEAYFSNGKAAPFDGSLDLPWGTPFQQSVWKQLQAIPCGETRSYRQLAASLGQPNASRAVGAAVGRNPLSLFIPCHRVIGSTGSLTGYAGGIERKQWLLRHETESDGLFQNSFPA